MKNEDYVDSLVFETFRDLEVNIPKELKRKISSKGQNITWNEWWHQIHFFKDKIWNKYVPDVIVCISNGGMIVGEIVVREYYKGTPLLSLWANRFKGEKKMFENIYNNKMTEAIKESFPKAKKIKILLIDDVVKTSTTFFQAKEYLEDKIGDQLELLFMTLYCINPDYLKNGEKVLAFSKRQFHISKEEYYDYIKTTKKRYPYGKDLSIQEGFVKQ